jgi:hypothetical protein
MIIIVLPSSQILEWDFPVVTSVQNSPSGWVLVLLLLFSGSLSRVYRQLLPTREAGARIPPVGAVLHHTRANLASQPLCWTCGPNLAAQ